MVVFSHKFLDFNVLTLFSFLAKENLNDGIPREKILYNFDELITHVKTSVDNFYGLNSEDTLEDYRYM